MLIIRYLITEGNEKTYKFTQEEILENVDFNTAKKVVSGLMCRFWTLSWILLDRTDLNTPATAEIFYLGDIKDILHLLTGERVN